MSLTGCPTRDADVARAGLLFALWIAGERAASVGRSQNGAHAARVAHMKIAMTPCAATLALHVSSVIATDGIYKRWGLRPRLRGGM